MVVVSADAGDDVVFRGKASGAVLRPTQPGLPRTSLLIAAIQISLIP
jgi:hypothetical protein